MPAVATAAADVDLVVAEWVASCYHDPLRFVLGAYPWGEPGPLQHHVGPDGWQRDFLAGIRDQVTAAAFDGRAPVAPVRRVVSSGHGCGKSTVVSWLVDWLMSTRPHAQGTITANTITQLQTKTWAALQRWTKLCLTGHWFTLNSERMYYNGHKASWFCGPQSSKEENSEAFAGQHAADSSSFYIFDEASAIPESIYEVAEGGLTDGEPFIFLFGNPTRNSGKFHRAAFGSERGRWSPVVVDSRTSRFTNKAQIEEWIADYGIDSDFVRVRVLGLPPSASDLQFIDLTRVTEAQRRQVEVLPDEPLVCALDVARGGDDNSVFRFRRGRDARSIPPVRIPGEKSRDSMKLVSLAAELLVKDYHGRKIHTLFVDGTGVGGPLCDRLRQLGHQNVLEVQFGAESPDPKCANFRAHIWSKLREWLSTGAIDTAPVLESDLTTPGYAHDKHDKLLLESKESIKKRGGASPDDGDALAMTFSQVINPRSPAPPPPYKPKSKWL